LLRQKEKRIDVAIRILGAPDAEMDVRNVVFDDPARADGADRRTLNDHVATLNRRRP
jgi:hypothetical protein